MLSITGLFPPPHPLYSGPRLRLLCLPVPCHSSGFPPCPCPAPSSNLPTSMPRSLIFPVSFCALNLSFSYSPILSFSCQPNKHSEPSAFSWPFFVVSLALPPSCPMPLPFSHQHCQPSYISPCHFLVGAPARGAFCCPCLPHPAQRSPSPTCFLFCLLAGGLILQSGQPDRHCQRTHSCLAAPQRAG